MKFEKRHTSVSRLVSKSRRREDVSNAREKRRLEFVDAIHEQFLERSKLSAVLAHMETSMAKDTNRAPSISVWIRRRIQQIDALNSLEFLNLWRDRQSFASSSD